MHTPSSSNRAGLIPPECTEILNRRFSKTPYSLSIISSSQCSQKRATPEQNPLITELKFCSSGRSGASGVPQGSKAHVLLQDQEPARTSLRHSKGEQPKPSPALKSRALAGALDSEYSLGTGPDGIFYRGASNPGTDILKLFTEVHPRFGLAQSINSTLATRHRLPWEALSARFGRFYD
jgi:hypothetical protein